MKRETANDTSFDTLYRVRGLLGRRKFTGRPRQQLKGQGFRALKRSMSSNYQQAPHATGLADSTAHQSPHKVLDHTPVAKTGGSTLVQFAPSAAQGCGSLCASPQNSQGGRAPRTVGVTSGRRGILDDKSPGTPSYSRGL